MARQPYLQINFNKHNPGRSLSVAQIVTAIRDQITMDHVAPGCRLPPVRALAHQLGMSKTTIQLAYDELVAQGLVESTEHVGLFVASDPQPVPVAPEALVAPPPCISLPSPALAAQTRAQDQGVLNLSSVFIDPALLPHERLSACFRSVVKQPQSYTDYHAQGFPPLRQAIAERLQARGIEASAEDIVITAGSQQALDLVYRVLKEKRIATENPAYSHGKALFEMNRMETLPLPLDPFHGIDADVWERQLAASPPALLYLTTNYQNPTGYSYTTSELQQILGWSQQYGFGILEDDWGSDMLSFSEFKPCLRARGGSGVLYINAFTKKLLPSLRLGYIVGNPEVTPALVASKIASCLGLSTLVEAALFEFLDRGYYETHLKQLQAELDQRYQHCLETLRDAMPDGVKWTAPGGGPSLWIELPAGVDRKRLRDRLARQQVNISLPENAFFGRTSMDSASAMRCCPGMTCSEASRYWLTNCARS